MRTHQVPQPWGETIPGGEPRQPTPRGVAAAALCLRPSHYHRPLPVAVLCLRPSPWLPVPDPTQGS